MFYGLIYPGESSVCLEKHVYSAMVGGEFSRCLLVLVGLQLCSSIVVPCWCFSVLESKMSPVDNVLLDLLKKIYSVTLFLLIGWFYLFAFTEITGSVGLKSTVLIFTVYVWCLFFCVSFLWNRYFLMYLLISLWFLFCDFWGIFLVTLEDYSDDMLKTI